MCCCSRFVPAAINERKNPQPLVIINLHSCTLDVRFLLNFIFSAQHLFLPTTKAISFRPESARFHADFASLCHNSEKYPTNSKSLLSFSPISPKHIQRQKYQHEASKIHNPGYRYGFLSRATSIRSLGSTFAFSLTAPSVPESLVWINVAAGVHYVRRRSHTSYWEPNRHRTYPGQRNHCILLQWWINSCANRPRQSN